MDKEQAIAEAISAFVLEMTGGRAFWTDGLEVKLFLMPKLEAILHEKEDPATCGICGDYSVKGVEVHQACLEAFAGGRS